MSNHNEDISTLDANEDEIVASDESEINDNEEKETGEEDENELSLQDKKEKTNKSNWKAMSKENKELRKANAELTAENEAWRKENPDLVKDVLSKGNNDFESRFFFIETPEAKDYKDEVLRTAQEYNIPYLKAWNLVKSELPPESKSKLDFNMKSAKPNVKKDLKDLNAEEALKLNSEDQHKWRILHGYEKE